MTTNPRNRIVVFRLRHDEYQRLKEACENAGARSISDFTRNEVLGYLRSRASAGDVHHRVAALEQQVEVMRFQLNHLLEGQSHAGLGQS
ncbi:MAG TPA: hypothetical protein VMU80_11725 [Bryobacteraceae bacterium]|nr:hypothetical protein [Bryobacteraceae bacterium]